MAPLATTCDNSRFEAGATIPLRQEARGNGSNILYAKCSRHFAALVISRNKLEGQMRPRCLAVRSLLTGVLVVVMLVVTGHSLSAQETVQNGAVFGTITDETGSALPGVTIEVSSPALQGKQSAVTDIQGAYRIGSLPAGVYRIEYSISGFRTDVRSDFSLAVGFNARVDVVMKLGSVEERVEVSGQSPIVDVSTSVVSNTFTRSSLDAVPTSRSIFQAVYLALDRLANTPDVGGSQLGNQQAMGSYGFSGNVVPLVDGINVLQANSINGGSSPETSWTSIP